MMIHPMAERPVAAVACLEYVEKDVATEGL